MLCINKLYPEAVHPCGPAEGIHYRYCLASRGIFNFFKYVQGLVTTANLGSIAQVGSGFNIFKQFKAF